MGEHEWVFTLTKLIMIVAVVGTPFAILDAVIQSRRERRLERERGPHRALLVRRVPPKVRSKRVPSEA